MCNSAEGKQMRPLSDSLLQTLSTNLAMQHPRKPAGFLFCAQQKRALLDLPMRPSSVAYSASRFTVLASGSSCNYRYMVNVLMKKGNTLLADKLYISTSSWPIQTFPMLSEHKSTSLNIVALSEVQSSELGFRKPEYCNQSRKQTKLFHIWSHHS